MEVLLVIAAVIVGLLLLGTFLLFFGQAKLHLTCRKRPKVVVSILGIRFVILSDKEEISPEKDLTRCHNPDRLLKKELRKRKKEAEKLRKKNEKAQKKAEMKAAKKKAVTTEVTPNLKENLEVITALIQEFYHTTKGKIKIQIHKFHIYVATDDAAKTAILYGVAVQAVSSLFQWIESHFTHLHRNPGDMSVEPDYTTDQTKVDVNLVCSIRIFHALKIWFHMNDFYTVQKTKALEKAKKRLLSTKKD